MSPSRRKKPPQDRLANWFMTGLLLVAIGVGLAGLNRILTDVAWWFVAMLAVLIVLATAATVRSFTGSRLWPVVGAIVSGVATVTLFFAPGTAILGVLPTLDTLDAFGALDAAGFASIADQDLPADAVQGIVYLLCLGAIAIAIAMDALTFAAKAPAWTGVPLLVLVLVPSLVRPELNDPFFFALVALAWLAILMARSRTGGRRAAVGMTVAAVVGALIVPLALPSVRSGDQNGGIDGVASGINPIITLGDDLRRGDSSLALTYTTTRTDGDYLRLTALDDFSGTAWKPSANELIRGNDLDEIGPPPGLGESIKTTPVTTSIAIGDVRSRWLPVPYAPTSVDRLEGTWNWEPDGLAIRTERSNARGQDYDVQSLLIAPSIEQLVAAGTTVDSGLERYLEVPADLPSIVANTAREVTEGAVTNYDRALALQDFFRDGDFTYSEEAPVEEGYDGSGASVLGPFLEAQSGYCVHFSSAMAAMSRVLGIPARVVVGFTAGQQVKAGEDGQQYIVTTDNLHAWPELYFSGIGWVRFEPTPGRGEVPAFAPAAVDNPDTPDVDESVPTPAPTVAPTARPTPLPVDRDPEATDPLESAQRGVTPGLIWSWVVLGISLAIALTPWALRTIRRGRRLGEVRRGSALAGWDELRDTAEDLGFGVSQSGTPRQFAAQLEGRLDDDGTLALSRLREALEDQTFAAGNTRPLAADVRRVARSMRRGSRLHRRLLARFVPRSLLRAWWPAMLGRVG